MEVILQDLALAFPFAFLAFWSAFLLSARSFFQHHSGNSSSLGWKYQRAEARPSKKGNANQYMDLEEEEEGRRRRRKRTSFVKKKVAHLFFNTWNVYFLKHRGVMEVVCTPLFVHGHSRTHNMSMQQSPTLVIFFLMSSSTSTFAASCSFKNFKRTWGATWKVPRFHIPRSMSWSSIHERIHCQLNSVQPKKSPHAIRKFELLAVPLVCHLVGVTNGSHLKHKAFIEHSGKTFDCMSLTCICIADIINTRSCCSHPCTCHSLQVLWLSWSIPPLDLKDCIRAVPLRSWVIAWWIVSPWTCVC